MKLYTHGSGKKTALLLHGMASSSTTWATLVKDLISYDYTIHTPDLPGHGEGFRGRSFYTVEKWESLLVEEVGKVDLLIGHSIGGLLALKTRLPLHAMKTVAIDPLLRFPTGPLRYVAQEIFGLAEVGITRHAQTFSKNSSSWDRTSVRALVRPKRLPIPDENVLIVRPKNSFVAPASAIKKIALAKVVTLDKVGHNLHVENYPRFFKELKEFALS